MRTARRNLAPAYRFAVVVLRPPLMALTRRDWAGAEHLPTDRGFVLVSNHISHADPLPLAHFVHDNGHTPHFLAKNQVMDLPGIGSLLRAAGQIPVYRETGRAADAYRAAVAAIREGHCVVVYPEGTLTREPELWPMRGKTGAARIALQTRCPVVPVVQWGAQDILGPYAHRPHLFPRKVMRMRAEPAVELADLYDEEPTREVLADATERIMAALTTGLEKLRGEPAPPGRYDPREHHQPPTGPPRESTQQPHEERR